jgi:hypothetical protein
LVWRDELARKSANSQSAIRIIAAGI